MKATLHLETNNYALSIGTSPPSVKFWLMPLLDDVYCSSSGNYPVWNSASINTSIPRGTVVRSFHLTLRNTDAGTLRHFSCASVVEGWETHSISGTITIIFFEVLSCPRRWWCDITRCSCQCGARPFLSICFMYSDYCCRERRKRFRVLFCVTIVGPIHISCFSISEIIFCM